MLPAVWLLLAPTKTASELIDQGPLSFGSFEQVAIAWNHLVDFQDGAVFVWLRNSAVYSTSVEGTSHRLNGGSFGPVSGRG